jgi:hypothetical protein
MGTAMLSGVATFPLATLTPGVRAISTALIGAAPSFPGALLTQQTSISTALLTVNATLRLATIATGNLLRNSAEGGTNGVAVTVGNSGGTSFDAFDVVSDGGTAFDYVKYLNVRPHGALSIDCASSASGNEYVAWTSSWPDTAGTCYIRAYFFAWTEPTTGANKLIRCYDSAGSEVAFFRIDTGPSPGPNPGIGDATGTFIEPSGPRTILNQWHRVELKIVPGSAGSITASIYSGANLDTTTADYTWTLTPAVVFAGVGNIAQVRFGNSILGTRTFFDDIGIRDDGPWGVTGTELEPQTLACSWVSATPSLGLATVTTTSPAQSFTTSLLFTTTLLYGAEMVNGLAVDGLLLDGAPSFPAGDLAVFGDQILSALDLTVEWEAFAATLTLESPTVGGRVRGTVGRQRSSRKVTHMAKRFQVGEIAHLGATCKVLGVLTNPTTVTLQIIAPQGDASSYTWADAEVDQDGTGLFSFDLPLTDEGTWQWRWVTSGACAGADEGEILVRSSAFV